MKTHWKLIMPGLALAVLAPVPGHASLFKKSQPVTVTLKTSQGQDAGTATLIQEGSKVKISLDLENLPEGDHAIHIHEHAKCDPPDFASAGGHFNPAHKQHGLKNPKGAHAGDMPMNISVEPDGTAHFTFETSSISLRKNAPDSVFANGGTSIVIHAKPDDMVSDPAGNAGARIACGVILPQ